MLYSRNAIEGETETRIRLVPAAARKSPRGHLPDGQGADAVVDDRLRVHGLERLRVADASVFPTMPSGNTNAPAIMVGERAADFLLEEA